MIRAWTLAPLLLAALACGSSHMTDDPEPDMGGRDFATDCRHDDGPPAPCYVDACCETVELATRNPVTCAFECTRGSTTCAPAPGCGSCGGVDAGPVAPCRGGPCCDEVRSPSTGPDCSFVCPDGLSFECAPDPSAFCAPDPRDCSVPSDCVVTANTCCGECGEATLEGSTSVNDDSLASYRDGLCEGDPLCPACAQSPNPDLVPTCAGGICEVIDVGRLSISECTSSDECRVRTVDCCECGGATERASLIAIRTDAEAFYAAQVCDPGFGCPECAPVYPDDVSAVCDAGRCTLAFEDAP